MAAVPRPVPIGTSVGAHSFTVFMKPALGGLGSADGAVSLGGLEVGTGPAASLLMKLDKLGQAKGSPPQGNTSLRRGRVDQATACAASPSWDVGGRAGQRRLDGGGGDGRAGSRSRGGSTGRSRGRAGGDGSPVGLGLGRVRRLLLLLLLLLLLQVVVALLRTDAAEGAGRTSTERSANPTADEGARQGPGAAGQATNTSAQPSTADGATGRAPVGDRVAPVVGLRVGPGVGGV